MATSSSLMTTACGAVFLVLIAGASAPAWSAAGNATDKYISGQGAQFESLAGSRENLASLAGGLRTGNRVTLTERTATGIKATTFDPPTKPMGYGNVTRSLNLASRQLTSVGITNPTAAELRAALNGGTVRTANGNVQLPGVLKLRSESMGWGKIAHTIGVSPGKGKPGGATVAARGTPPSASARVPGNGRGPLVSAAGPSHTPRTPGHGSGDAFGRSAVPSAGMHGGIGHGVGNAHGHGRAGK
jgi:hypothetical protein